MSTIINLNKKLIEILQAGFEGWTVNNQSVKISEKLYPEAIAEIEGTNNFPCIVLRDDGDEEFEGKGGQRYDGFGSRKLYIYVNDIDINSQLAQIEDKIIDIMSLKAQLNINEALVLITSRNRGDKLEGIIDYYAEGYYDTVSISSITTSIKYTRCTNG
jgi:hypothetical protein